jgi:glutamyl-tRNA synthetase
MMTGKIRTRIAPTPSGYLHEGNLFSFVLTWLIAKRENGTVRLRIDDMDAARMRREYLEDIFATLEWIGLQPDEGPTGIEDFLKNFSQQNHLPLYQNLVEKLVNTGKVYACTCSRKQILALNTEGIYPGTCLQKHLAIGHENAALRIHINKEETWISISGFEKEHPIHKVDLQKTMGDFVIRKKDGLPAYQITSLADDLQDEMNLIVRGEDLLSSTAAQVFMANSLGENTFSSVRFLHHPLILNKDGEKLSKSAGHSSIKNMREQGISQAHFFNYVADYLKLPNGSYTTLHQLLETFSNQPTATHNFLDEK